MTGGSIDGSSRKTSGVGASAPGAGLSLSVETARQGGGRSRGFDSPPIFKPRNLGLSGERPADVNVPRGYYLDILV